MQTSPCLVVNLNSPHRPAQNHWKQNSLHSGVTVLCAFVFGLLMALVYFQAQDKQPDIPTHEQESAETAVVDWPENDPLAARFWEQPRLPLATDNSRFFWMLI